MKNKILRPLSITALFILLNAVTAFAQVCPSKSNAPWELWIAKVQLNTLNNASDKFKDYNTLGYSDFTNLSATLTKGQSYPLTITAGLSWSGVSNNAYCRAWIDWNGDNTFQNSELVAASSSTNPFIGYVRVPDNVTVGDKRMRIAMKLGEFPTVCENFAGGEVEDYTVTVAEPTQTTGYDLIVSNLTVPPRLTLNVIDTIRFDIKNIGDINSRAINISVYLSTDNQLSDDDVFYNSLLSDRLAPNESRTFTNPVLVPSTWTSETAYSIVRIKSSANEINASNNTATAPSNVFLRPLTCANQISVNNTVLCYDNANPNAIKINVAEGDTVFQKIVNKNGQVLSTSPLGNLKRDSVFVVNNQVIKKLANGTIAYTKTITPSVLSRYSPITLAVEMTDGSFVLAGLQKYREPSGYSPLNRDSLVLITTDAQLNYEQSEVVFQNSGPYVPPYNGVLELMYLPNNQFLVMYYVGRSERSIEQSMLHFTKYQKNNAQLQRLNDYNNGSYLIGKPILFTVCGNNLLFKNEVDRGSNSKGGTGGGIYSSIFNLDSMRGLTSKSTISTYWIGGSSTQYSYSGNPNLRPNTIQISGNYG
jgi:GEVED domain/CARDB